MNSRIKARKRLSSFQIIILGFLALILIGALLLMLPFSTNEGEVTSFGDAFFTSTSAVCVTGMLVKDTATYWSGFGQAVILVLIQIGGMGVVTIAASISLIAGKKISLMQRTTMQEAIAAPKMGGIVKTTGFVIKVALVIELIGAILLLPVFCRDYGVKGIWMSVFHSVSAFCNAGFDILGTAENEFVSLTPYSGNVYLSIVIMLLVIIGGIGFLTWEDVKTYKLHFKKYCVQSKVCLTVTGILILLPALYFFIFEFAGESIGDRFLNSVFQSVIVRTAGFSMVDFTAYTDVGRCLIIILILIGGAPGSLAGGMKTTTVAVLFANARAVFGRKEDAHFFRRRIDDNAVESAATLIVMYVVLFVTGGMIISVVEGISLGTCLFEAASALSTAGMTYGITQDLGVVSKIILLILMFLGRVGGLTLIHATLSNKARNISKLPEEKIIIG